MAPPSLNGSSRRQNPFTRSSLSPSPAPQSSLATAPGRPKSVAFTPPAGHDGPGHSRNSSFPQPSGTTNDPSAARQRSNSSRSNNTTSNTFAPQFIKSDELKRGAEQIRGLEGDNDFSGKKYVWLKDPEKAFVRGLVLEESEDGILQVQREDGSVRPMNICCPTSVLMRFNSNLKSVRKTWTKSILRSLTRPMIWRSSRI